MLAILRWTSRRKPRLDSVTILSSCSRFQSGSIRFEENRKRGSLQEENNSNGNSKGNGKGYGSGNGYGSNPKSSFSNLVGYRRRNNLTELPKLNPEDKKDPKFRKRVGEDTTQDLIRTIRFKQKELNSELSEIHSIMKSNIREIFKRKSDLQYSYSSYNDETKRLKDEEFEKSKEILKINEKLWLEAWKLFSNSPKPWQRDFRVYNQIIAMAFKAGKYNAAMDLVMEFKKLALTPSLSTFTTVFSGLSTRHPPLLPSNLLFKRAQNLFSELESMRTKAFNSDDQAISREIQGDEEESDYEGIFYDKVHLPDKIEESDSPQSYSKEETVDATKELRLRTLQMNLDHFRTDREGLVGAYTSYLRLLMIVGQRKEADQLFDRLASESFSFREDFKTSKDRKVNDHKRRTGKVVSMIDEEKSKELEGIERYYTFLPPYPHKALFTIMLKSDVPSVFRFRELLQMWKFVDDALKKEINQFKGEEEKLMGLKEEWKEIQFDPIAMAAVLSFTGRIDVRSDLQKHLNLQDYRIISTFFERYFFEKEKESSNSDQQHQISNFNDESHQFSDFSESNSSQDRRPFSREERLNFPNVSQFSRVLYNLTYAKKPESVLRLMNQLDSKDELLKSVELDHKLLNSLFRACSSLKDSKTVIQWLEKKSDEVDFSHETYSLAMKVCSVVDLEDRNKGLENSIRVWEIWRKKLIQIKFNPNKKDGKMMEIDLVRQIVKYFLITLHRARISRNEKGNLIRAEEGSAVMFNGSESDSGSIILETRKHLKWIFEIHPILDGDGSKWLRNLVEDEKDQKRKTEGLTVIARIIRNLTDLALLRTKEEKKMEEDFKTKVTVGKYQKGKDKYGRDRELMKVKKQSTQFHALNVASRAWLGAFHR